jgi:hypothetical protein
MTYKKKEYLKSENFVKNINNNEDNAFQSPLKNFQSIGN